MTRQQRRQRAALVWHRKLVIGKQASPLTLAPMQCSHGAAEIVHTAFLPSDTHDPLSQTGHVSSLTAAFQASNGLQTLVPQVAAGAGLSVPDYLRIVDNYVKVQRCPLGDCKHDQAV